MTSIIRQFRPRIDAARLAVLAERAAAELANFQPRPIVRTHTPPVAGIAPKMKTKPGKPVRDETGQTYESATAAAHTHGVKPSDLAMSARSAGRYRCAGVLWWYVEDK
jgi:hypothetical protein